MPTKKNGPPPLNNKPVLIRSMLAVQDTFAGKAEGGEEETTGATSTATSTANFTGTFTAQARKSSFAKHSSAHAY